jgi:hypothetical protein
MANETITSGAGLRKARVFALDANGVPTQVIDVTGVKAITLNVPENQIIVHVGDDQAFAQDFLPPNTLPSGSFTTAKANQTLDALLSNTLVDTIGETEMDGQFTDKAGYEIDAMMEYHRQALVTQPGDADFGSRRWQNFWVMRSRITPQGNSPDQGSDDVNNYQMVPTPAIETPWGVTFSEEDNGFGRAVRVRTTSEYPQMLDTFTGNNTVTDFVVNYTPISVAKTKAWVNGVLTAVSSVTPSTKTVTFSPAPANVADVRILYETSANITPS